MNKNPKNRFVKGHPGYTRTHGMHLSPEYIAWRAMKARCLRPNHPEYRNYGARGIAVCASWVASFEVFLGHVGLRPSSRHSLDRIDNDGNYEPGNVRWATKREQCSNQRTNRWIEFDGRRMIVSDWAREIGLKPNSLQRRLASYPLEIALSPTRLRGKRRKKTLEAASAA